MNQDQLKQLVGQKAVEFVKDGMYVGLGTGSTVKFMVDALGERVQKEHLNIVGVSTSERTAAQAKSLGIPMKSVDDVDHLDLTIDGADEISADFQGVKGGGAALLWEKIVAINTDKVMWIVDESKMVDQLGAFGLPVEVIPYGSKHVFDKMAARGYNPVFRKVDGEFVRTDSNNYLIDLHINPITDPHALAEDLIHMVGVVEHGLFLDMVNTVIVGHENGPEVIQARP
ncbi:ribose-5-phosphate isomerase RpiA [Lactiplantibacillus fabifermentans]|uniref:Ribose-5-phosphate isomerase A n=2 Tax=Lactiplantibacillus fabifermentans TaxID=483011 RepID=A0A0R2N9I4_9LACO|nr:ribose-5-phosphate isomerase RpiA [Lactiplantibacillus fabifermentans]ETY75205.1 ribose 5-phosphate isomerase [Lactiplantibacillus fabifermentans T30PCM01]KRO22520.1 ribose-5-phosphate isomerase A [Lactiplantibacillus fabifermentans DSM 21115]